MKNLNFDSLFRGTIFLIFATLFVFILIVGQGIIVPLTISFFIAFLLIPLNMLLERIHVPRVLAAILSVILTLIALAGILFLFGSQIGRFASDMDQIIEKLADLKDKLPESISSNFEGSFSLEGVMAFVKKHMGQIFTSMTSVLGGLGLVIVVPIFIALILIYRDHLKEFAFRVFDNDRAKIHREEHNETKSLITRVRKVVQKYLTGVFYVMCILFVLYSILFFALGLKHAMLFAAIAAVLNIIPYIGPITGSLLPMMFSFVTQDSLFYPMAILVGTIVIQSVESNFLTPKIVGNNVSLNPFVTLLAIIVGGTIWGVVGMILFIPMTAILKEILGAVDGLHPYAYVLGNPEEPEKKIKFISQITDKIKKVPKSKPKS